MPAAACDPKACQSPSSFRVNPHFTHRLNIIFMASKQQILGVKMKKSAHFSDEEYIEHIVFMGSTKIMIHGSLGRNLRVRGVLRLECVV